LLQPGLEPVDLPVRFRLAEAGRPIEAVYFLESGIASVTTNVRHETPIEIGIVGHEGVVNVPALMGIDRSPSETFMQIRGAGFQIPVERLREALAQSPTLMPILLRFVMSTWCRPPPRCLPTDVPASRSDWLAGY
jgi:CRP-like cAMP-binding protein